VFPFRYTPTTCWWCVAYSIDPILYILLASRYRNSLQSYLPLFTIIIYPTIVNTQRTSQREQGTNMKTKHKRGLLAILVATTTLLIFFSGTAVSQEIPVEEKISTLEPAIENDFEKPLPTIKLYAKHLVTEQWGVHEWNSFDTLIQKESSWNYKAQNPHSTAFGLGQFLNGTWDDVGCVKTEDKNEQIRCTIKYIEQRYGTPSKALAFHISNGHY